MKFLTKINRNYFLLLTITLLIATVSSYFILQFILQDNAKERLFEKKELIKNQIFRTGEIPNVYPIIEVKKETEKTSIEPVFKEINIYNKSEDEDEVFLEYSNQIMIKNIYYTIKLRQSYFESEDIKLMLTGFLGIILLLTFGISFLVSKKINKMVWDVFQKNLLEIEKFSFITNQKLQLRDTDIEEFDRLNFVVEKLTDKLNADYLALKEFSENASHEIQTPISIALLNLDEILQQDLNKETFEKVVVSINALKRLSTLNQSLILLTKIGNRQFITDKVISFGELTKFKLNEFTSLFDTKKIEVELNMEDDFLIKMNEELAEILINNLLSNAIKHNEENGKIQLSIKKNEFKICNSGKHNSLTNNTIFSRFTKGDSKSYGLGLAIVMDICKTSKLNVHYSKDKFHCFYITKSKK
ncbi:MAG: HAMP domain-containing sensor histidine kinase [Paludibacter sp.]|nr:HAMP domain-containing sensor histidine kinase [Paludibacter sp.]